MRCTGRVTKKRRNIGSKSEREAVTIESDHGEFVLRVLGGNAYRDPRLEALVGKRIRCDGTPAGKTLLLTDWSEIGE
jgi:hypothetical protein